MGGLETKINAVSTKIKNREEEKNLKKEVINTLTKFYSLVKDKKIPIEKYYEKVRSFEEILTNKNKQENEVVYMCKNQLESLRSEINKKYPWTKEAFYKGFKRIFMYTEKNAIKYAEKISKEKNMDHIVIFRNGEHIIVPVSNFEIQLNTLDIKEWNYYGTKEYFKCLHKKGKLTKNYLISVLGKEKITELILHWGLTEEGKGNNTQAREKLGEESPQILSLLDLTLRDILKERVGNCIKLFESINAKLKDKTKTGQIIEKFKNKNIESMDYKEMLSLIRDLKIEKLLEVNTNEKDIQNFLKALNEDIEIHNDVLEKEKKGLKKDSKEYKNIRKKQKILEKNKKDNQIIINNESVSKIAINYVNNEYVEREVAMSGIKYNIEIEEQKKVQIIDGNKIIEYTKGDILKKIEYADGSTETFYKNGKRFILYNPNTWNKANAVSMTIFPDGTKQVVYRDGRIQKFNKNNSLLKKEKGKNEGKQGNYGKTNDYQNRSPLVREYVKNSITGDTVTIANNLYFLSPDERKRYFKIIIKQVDSGKIYKINLRGGVLMNINSTSKKGGEYKISYNGDPRVVNIKKEKIRNIIELGNEIGDLKLNFLAPHISKIVEKINSSENSSNKTGIKFNPDDGLSDKEKELFLNSIGKTLIPGYKEHDGNITELKNQFKNIATINTNINKDKELSKRILGGVSDLESLAKFKFPKDGNTGKFSDVDFLKAL